MLKQPFLTYLKTFLIFSLVSCNSIFSISGLSYAGNHELMSNEIIEDLKLKPVTILKGTIGDFLRKWYTEGTAAGNIGDYYDNRDRGHSHLKMENYPQLQTINYSKEERKQQKDYAAQRFLLPHVVIGNSSTSAPVKNGGSNIRTYYTNPAGMAFLYNQYRNNNLYIYPAHHDYRKQAFGDVFPTNSPYLIASKGSSGSDKKYMNAVAQILAAFHPEVKKMLVETGFLMPTIQMILRYSSVGNWKEYLTGKAHPTAGIGFDNLTMIKMAHDLQADEIPPIVQLKVVEESVPLNGEDFFSPGKSVKLADTPCVIARLFRGKSYWYRMVVSAEDSLALNDEEITYHWKILHGDKKKISIRPLNSSGSVVEIKIFYHDGQPITQKEDMESNRVDIGVFIRNGKYYSAPGFITSFSLNNEARTYDEAGRILEIGYGMGKSTIKINDWNGFFKLFEIETSIPSQILRTRLSRDVINLINSTSGDFRAISEEIEATKKDLENRQEANKKELRKKLREQERAQKKLLVGKQRGQKYAINESVLHALYGLIEDPEFVNIFNLDIIKLFSAVSEDNKTAFEKELVRLETYGILKKKSDFTIEILPVRSGQGTPGKRLTKFEYTQIKNLNATALSRLFFPGITKSSFEVNFVDQRLFTPKFWRDVYHYSNTGQMVGWTRYNEDGKTVFNKDGLIVLEKDVMGRCIKGQTVEYHQALPKLDGKGRRLWVNENPLKYTPGKEIWLYEYQDDSDWLGKVVQIEKL